MNSSLSKIMSMVNGQDRNDFDSESVSAENRTKIDAALESVFIGKSMQMWANGGKLIDAWNRALDDLRDEMFAIPNTMPVVAYLRQAVFEHRTHWNVKMTKSNEKNSVAYFENADEKAQLLEYANAQITTGMNTIRCVIANATDGVAHTQHGANIRPMEHSRSNTREHERVRKR